MLSMFGGEDFQYVVERIKPAKVCFGSGVQRDTNPIGKGLSPFQRRFGNEIFTKITPQTYDIENITSGVSRLQNKVRSNQGVPGLANKSQRFPHRTRTHFPSPTRYDPEPVTKTFKQNKLPFNRSLPKKSDKRFSTPGVGSYDPRPKHCMRTKFDYNFGMPTMVPAVELVCTPTPPNTCDRCGSVCNDDYWHNNYTIYMCHICMEEEKALHEDYKHEELREFQKIRICSYMHSHEGATAAVNLLPPEKLLKREQLENYLSVFISSV